MAKFKIGDRVKVRADYDVEIARDVYPNSTGTITENDSDIPYVMWDNPQMIHQHFRKNIHGAKAILNWRFVKAIWN